MSWGATAFTPMISFNNPPFGFAERITPPDFPTCPENPYSATDELKESIDKIFTSKRKLKETFGFPLVGSGGKTTMEGNCLKLILFLLFVYLVYRYLQK